MDATRIDRLATFFADRRLSRRQAVRQGSRRPRRRRRSPPLGLRGAAAQDAAPVATPTVDPTDPAPQRRHGREPDPEYLFVQPFDSPAPGRPRRATRAPTP